MFDVTIAICTYNGAARLPKVLQCLRSQRHSHTFSWSVLVVDNNSTDATAEVAQHYQVDWPQTYPLFYVFEPRQGLAFARRCAIEQTQSPLIAFLDDDNWPDPDWVAAVHAFGSRHPQVGAYGGQILPHYEVPPPTGFDQIAACLAVNEQRLGPHRYSPHQWRFPAGAGLVVRRQAWLDTVPDQPRLKGVCGSALTSKGEDLESLSYLNLAGWEIWHNPAMQIEHFIPRHRLEPEYLIRLFRGIGLSRYPTRMIRFRAWQRPLVIPLYVLNDLRKLLAYRLSHQASGSQDTVLVCQQTLLFYSLISPFYHGQQALQRAAQLLGLKLGSLKRLIAPTISPETVR
ncbi:hormogonium polysaccharide biosynthesis glycosyltransferase HpsE [Pseudanabaena sp. FACHB-2040]|uniref:hormogonium polysaccharide biosynthesis glycosyltransferase HpsE n=1 Tax=Pseudanabaena sp. FACHB-2040 TaxID=2692859 RepID=UPI00168226C5|nr:glycosyltransferase [Pseudanabaena sp. FACHB-2040]